MTYGEGQTVWLREFDNGESVQPRQRAVIDGFDERPWGTSITVTVGREWRDNEFDDGLREVTEDQIEGPA